MRAAALPALLLALVPAAAADPPAQEVRLHLVLSERPHGTEGERDRIRELEEELLGLLETRRAGQLTRDRWEGGVCVVTLSAPDARRAWAVIEAAVRGYGPRRGSYVVLHAGPAAAEERIPLDDPPPPQAPAAPGGGQAAAPTPPP